MILFHIFVILKFIQRIYTYFIYFTYKYSYSFRVFFGNNFKYIITFYPTDRLLKYIFMYTSTNSIIQSQK